MIVQRRVTILSGYFSSLAPVMLDYFSLNLIKEIDHADDTNHRQGVRSKK